MTAFVCETCGVQFAPRADRPEEPPASCPICEDDRQYVGLRGQRWTTIEGLRASGRRNHIVEVEPGMTAIETRPSVGIGQRAVVIATPVGNVLWECLSALDDETVAAVRELGGVQAIAISHPHFYASMIEWSRAFGAEIYLHTSNRQWVMRPDGAIRYWDGEAAPDFLAGSGLTLVRTGGHFPGMTGLHWPGGAEGRGVFLGGDMPQVVMDRRWVSFMYSYPNLIPLPASEIRRIVAALDGYRFDRLYGSWPDRVVERDATGAIHRSAERYLRQIGADRAG